MFAQEIHKKGVVNEIKAQLFFTENDYDVFVPIHNKTRADFIAVKGTEVLRVQVKTAQNNGDYIQCRLDIEGTRYTEDDCDVIVFIKDKRIWIAPIKEISGFSSVCLGKKEGMPYKSYKEYDSSKWEVKWDL